MCTVRSASRTVRLCDRRVMPRPSSPSANHNSGKLCSFPFRAAIHAALGLSIFSVVNEYPTSIDGQLMDTMGMLMTDERQRDSPINTSATARWIDLFGHQTRWHRIKEHQTVRRETWYPCSFQFFMRKCIWKSPECNLIHLWHPYKNRLRM